MLQPYLAFPRICVMGKSLIEHKIFQKESQPRQQQTSPTLGKGCHPAPTKVTAHTEGTGISVAQATVPA